MTEVCVVMIGSISGLWLEIQSEQFLCLWGTFLMWLITEGQHSGLWSVDPTLQDLMIDHGLLDILLSCLSNQTASEKGKKWVVIWNGSDQQYDLPSYTGLKVGLIGHNWRISSKDHPRNDKIVFYVHVVGHYNLCLVVNI